MAGLTGRITIAGGGLAGLSLGIALLRRGAMVTLHEAGRYPRHRVCGEFLSGVRESTLEKLGIAGHFRDARTLETSMWFDAKGPLCKIRVPGLGISRWTLDSRLQEDFSHSGGDLRTGSRAAPGEGVVWAAGRVRTGSEWIGLKCHVHRLPLGADMEMHMGSNGYAGLARVEGDRVNVCGLFRAGKGVGGRDALFQSLRAGGLDALAERIASASPDPESFCAVAGFRTGVQAGPSFSIGDAARIIPPFTGNGMTMALESAECALDPLLEYASGKITWQQAEEFVAWAQRRRFSRRMRVAGVLHNLLCEKSSLLTALARRGAIPFQLLVSFLR